VGHWWDNAAVALIEKRSGRDGRTSYRVRIRLQGFPQFTKTFPKRTAADLWAKATEADLQRGFAVASKEAARRTLSQAIDRYIEHTLPHKRRNRDAAHVEHYLERWRRELGGVAVSNITPARISEVKEKLLHEETPRGGRRAGGTVNKYLAALSGLFKTACREWQWCTSNPVALVAKAGIPRGIVRFLSDDERGRLLKACQENPAEWLYPLVLLALNTAARRGELLALAWADVDLAGGRILIQESKNADRRALPIAGPIVALLRERARIRLLGDDRVFPGDRPDRPRDIERAWRAALKASGVEKFRFHDLRHTAASYLAMTGATHGELAAVLGHRTLAMVKRYAHLSDQHTAGVVRRMTEKFFSG